MPSGKVTRTSPTEPNAPNARARRDHVRPAATTSAQLKYQGSATGENTATASIAIAACRIVLAGWPSLASHHCRTTSTSSTTRPMSRATVR